MDDMKKYSYICLMTLMITVGLVHEAWAVRDPRPIAGDPRLRTLVYSPDDVFRYVGFLGYQANIEFAYDEEIENISMGDSTSWQIIPEGRRIFLKPTENSDATNMTVLTNRRIYQFEMHIKEVETINDPDMIFAVRFIYPDDGNQSSILQFGGQTSGVDIDLSSGKYNFHYKINGANSISPLMIFDDGEFTYFKFKDKNAEVPAFFLVDSDGQEALVNYRVAGEYIVVERVTSQFTLRNGSDVVCVFNEMMPLEKSSTRRTNLFGFEMNRFNDAR